MNKFSKANEEWKDLLEEFRVTRLERWIYLISLLSLLALGIAHIIELGWWDPVGAVNMLSNPWYAALFLLGLPVSMVPVKTSIRQTFAGLKYRAQLERKGFLFGAALSMALITWFVLAWSLPWVILVVFLTYHILQYLMMEDTIRERGEELTQENLSYDEWYAKTRIDEEAAWMERHLAEGKALGRAEYLDRKGDVKAWVAGLYDLAIKYKKEAQDEKQMIDDARAMGKEAWVKARLESIEREKAERRALLQPQPSKLQDLKNDLIDGKPLNVGKENKDDLGS